MSALAAAALVAVLAAVGGGGGGRDALEAWPRIGAGFVSTEAEQVKLGEPPPDPEKQRKSAIERARRHLSKTLGLEPGEIILESATATTWPDASLGCPEKDRMYAQVVTDGYKVILRAHETTHELHVSPKRVVLCKQAGG